MGLPACPPVEGLKRTTKGTALALVGLAATVVALFIFSAGGTPGSDTQTVVVATTCEAVSGEAAEDIASGCQRAPVTAITIHQAERRSTPEAPASERIVYVPGKLVNVVVR